MEKLIYGTWAAVAGLAIKVFVWDSDRRSKLYAYINGVKDHTEQTYQRKESCLLVEKLQEERYNNIMKKLDCIEKKLSRKRRR